MRKILTGWLDRNGRHYPCWPWDHLPSAARIVKARNIPIIDDNAEHTLDKKGWVKIHNNAGFTLADFTGRRKLTKKQEKWLLDNDYDLSKEYILTLFFGED